MTENLMPTPFSIMEEGTRAEWKVSSGGQVKSGGDIAVGVARDWARV